MSASALHSPPIHRSTAVAAAASAGRVAKSSGVASRREGSTAASSAFSAAAASPAKALKASRNRGQTVRVSAMSQQQQPTSTTADNTAVGPNGYSTNGLGVVASDPLLQAHAPHLQYRW